MDQYENESESEIEFEDDFIDDSYSDSFQFGSLEENDLEDNAYDKTIPKKKIIGPPLNLTNQPKTETNQLYSVLFHILNDCQMLISRNRSSLPFSISAEIENLKDSNIYFSDGKIKHKKFNDDMDCSNLKKASDVQSLLKYINFVYDIVQKSLPPIVQSASKLLKDPLVRQHKTLAKIKQRINELQKENKELSVQTRHTANRLVQMSSPDSPKTTSYSTGKSDVMVQQQRLKHALARVDSLKEQNESTAASNSELKDQLLIETERKRSGNSSPKIPQNIALLQKKIAEITANLDQGEEENETAMAQRRVSLSRMNKSTKKLMEEINILEEKLAETENKIRIMTQGKAVKEKKVVQQQQQIKQTKGSKIPVQRHSPIK
ncbi:hypothetical protein GPJ56_009363 [Histomonas meleagridis]|uniref:uncharacterized protein n=1 Tax=Histomonas meleagridis TaxID=135588 RepID=UPI003559D672|nr:hypothetical protein GPJ56_009363 [Histomonas meleagridis]KAH0797315.1 hypothetical protein GO595_009997 [Histomonas meleagridis]